jgi:hypothetical protein
MPMLYRSQALARTFCADGEDEGIRRIGADWLPLRTMDPG